MLEVYFMGYKNDVRKCLKKTPINDIVDNLTSAKDIDDSTKVFLESRVDKLFDAVNCDHLFGILNFGWTYLDPSLLDRLVRSFNLEDVKDQTRTYRISLQHFRKKTLIIDFIGFHRAKAVHPSVEFLEAFKKFNWSRSLETVTLEHVEQFRQKFDVAFCHGLLDCSRMVAKAFDEGRLVDYVLVVII